MSTANATAPVANRMGSWDARPETLLAWEQESTPRLEPSDLSNPQIYYRRLETYIMNIK